MRCQGTLRSSGIRFTYYATDNIYYISHASQFPSELCPLKGARGFKQSSHSGESAEGQRTDGRRDAMRRKGQGEDDDSMAPGVVITSKRFVYWLSYTRVNILLIIIKHHKFSPECLMLGNSSLCPR